MDKDILKENEHLLDGLHRGDDRIIKFIFQSYLPSVKSLIFKQGGDTQDAEDVFMDGLEAIHIKLHSTGLVLDRASFKTYLTQVCLFQWSKKKRRKKWESPVTNEHLGVFKDRSDFSESLAEIDRFNLVRLKMELLGEVCKQILNWSVVDKKSMKEIADYLKISEGSARKKKFDCKQRLFKLVQSDPIYKELLFPS